MKIDMIKAMRFAGMALTVVGTLLTGLGDSKENKRTIEKLVEEHLKNK